MRKQRRISYCLSMLVLVFLLMGMGFGWTQNEIGSADKPDKTTEETSSMDDDLDDLNEQLKPGRESLEKVDIMATLNKIIEKMGDAEGFLSQASIWKALTPQEQAGHDIDKIIKQQEKALKELNKLFKNTKGSQKQAIKEISKLIKLARQQGQGQGSSQGQKQPQPKKIKPQNKQPQPQQKKPGHPADKPYEATGTLPHGLRPFTDDLAKKWGNLPPKLRDAILEMKQDELISEYLERLEKYFKILASEEE